MKISKFKFQRKYENIGKKFNKKSLFICLIFFLFLLLFLMFSGIMLKKSNIQPIQLENIKIEIKEGTLTRSGATIVITDLGKNKTSFGDSYLIEKKVFNKWKTLKCKNEWWTMQGYHANPDMNNQLIMTVNWENNYGKLSKGKYRLLKDINGKYIAVEFTIN